MRTAALVLLLCMGLNGCYSFGPARSADPSRASRVQVRLREPRDFRLLEYTANQVVVVDGEIVRADADSLVLSALRLEAISGYEFVGGGMTVAVDRGNVVEIKEKRLDLLRTGLLVGAAVAAGVGFDAAGGLGGGGGGGGGPSPQ